MINWEEDFREMCKYYLSIMEGDTHLVEDAYALTYKHGITDENGFEIFEDDIDPTDYDVGGPKYK